MDGPVVADEHRRGHADDAVVLDDALVQRLADGVGDIDGLQEREGLRPFPLEGEGAHVDAQHHGVAAALLQMLPHLLEVRHLGPAGRAQRRPEVDDDGAALQVAEADLRGAAEVLAAAVEGHGEVRGAFAVRAAAVAGGGQRERQEREESQGRCVPHVLFPLAARRPANPFALSI